MSRHMFQTLLIVALVGVLSAPVEIARWVFRRPYACHGRFLAAITSEAETAAVRERGGIRTA